MTFGSLFAGIGGFDLGLERSGMTCMWQCEIDKYAKQVLKKHWPEVKKYEDIRQLTKPESVDLICGGFPCQDLSMAGNRAGLAGERSGLFFEAVRIIREVKPKWIVIENVPGLLSSNGTADMGAVVWQLEQLGYCISWRVLDSRYFGVAQRRRRIFIVGSLGNTSSIKVLFETEQKLLETVGSRMVQSPTLVANGQVNSGANWCGGIVIGTLIANGQVNNGGGNWAAGTVISTLKASGVNTQSGIKYIKDDLGYRTLTPTECEKLQGFPVNWTEDIPDSKRFKTLGNAVTVNVIEWIGKRIQEVENG